MTLEQELILVGLYKEYYKSLCLFAHEAIGNWYTAEDLVSRTLEIACIKVGELKPQFEPKAWLIGILKNEIRNYWRINKIRKEHIAEIDEAEEYPDDKAFEEFDHVDYIKPVGLSEEDFELIKQITLGGYSYTEIARRLGISEAACRKRFQRAKERFKAKYKEEERREEKK